MSYNYVLKYLMGLNTRTRTSQHMVQNDIVTFNALQRNIISSFRERVLASQNRFIHTTCNSTFFIYSSHLMKAWTDLTH